MCNIYACCSSLPLNWLGPSCICVHAYVHACMHPCVPFYTSLCVSLWASISVSLWASICVSLCASISVSLWASISVSLCASICVSLCASICVSLCASISIALPLSRRGRVRPSLHRLVHGTSRQGLSRNVNASAIVCDPLPPRPGWEPARSPRGWTQVCTVHECIMSLIVWYRPVPGENQLARHVDGHSRCVRCTTAWILRFAVCTGPSSSFYPRM